jgi:hypothetical protein
MVRAHGDIVGDTRGPDSDRVCAFEIADRACGGSKGAGFEMAADALVRAVELLDQHWDAIERAAELLCDEGKLSEAQLRAALRESGDPLGRVN